MREVVDDGDAVDFVADFETTFDAFESGKGGLDYLFGDALACGKSGRRGGIERVVLAGKMHFEFRPERVVMPHFPAGTAVFMAKIAHLPVGLSAEAIALYAAKCAADAFGDIGAAVVGDQESAARHEIDEAFERDFDCLEVSVDVRVIKLDVGENKRVWKIVKEFRALVEEGGVVFIAFDDEYARGAKLKAGAEIFCDATD